MVSWRYSNLSSLRLQLFDTWCIVSHDWHCVHLADDRFPQRFKLAFVCSVSLLALMMNGIVPFGMLYIMDCQVTIFCSSWAVSRFAWLDQCSIFRFSTIYFRTSRIIKEATGRQFSILLESNSLQVTLQSALKTTQLQNCPFSRFDTLLGSLDKQ